MTQNKVHNSLAQCFHEFKLNIVKMIDLILERVQLQWRHLVLFGILKEHYVREGFKKKNLEFPRFGLSHPPTLVIAENLEKK